MNPRSKGRWRVNAAYEPWAARVDHWVRCTVCGFPNDEIRTHEGNGYGAISLLVTGTKYQPDVGGNYDDVDLQVDPRVAAYNACAFCGATNWRAGHGPEGLAL